MIYSLSLLVFRTSGSLPKRPIRTNFAKSAERDVVVENACKNTKVKQESSKYQLNIRTRREIRADLANLEAENMFGRRGFASTKDKESE